MAPACPGRTTACAMPCPMFIGFSRTFDGYYRLTLAFGEVSVSCLSFFALLAGMIESYECFIFLSLKVTQRLPGPSLLGSRSAHDQQEAASIF